MKTRDIFIRLMDLAVAMFLIVPLTPAILVIALLIRLCMGSPVFFRQARPGKDGKSFRIWKFRTMTSAVDSAGSLLPDAERLTPLGRKLRHWNLDELPQLINVIAGDMSLVGPRPLIFRYLERYTPRQSLRMRVKPGITGWAQIHGKKALDWEKRLELDVWYVENQSMALNIRILIRTFFQILSGRMSSDANSTEAGEFWGAHHPESPPDQSLPVTVDGK